MTEVETDEEIIEDQPDDIPKIPDQGLENTDSAADVGQTENLENEEPQSLQPNDQIPEQGSETPTLADDTQKEIENVDLQNKENVNADLPEQEIQDNAQSNLETSQDDTSSTNIHENETQDLAVNNQNQPENAAPSSYDNINVDSTIEYANETEIKGDSPADEKQTVDNPVNDVNESETSKQTTDETNTKDENIPDSTTQPGSAEKANVQTQHANNETVKQTVQHPNKEPDPLSLDVLDELEELNQPQEKQPQPQTKTDDVIKKIEQPPTIQETAPKYEVKPEVIKDSHDSGSIITEKDSQQQEHLSPDSFIYKTNAWFSPNFRNSVKSFYQLQEKFFVQCIIPLYNKVKSSPILTALLFFFILIKITKAVKGFFSLFVGGPVIQLLSSPSH